MWKVFQHVKINNQIPATEGELIKAVNEFMFGEYLRKHGSYYNNDFGGYNARGKGANGGARDIMMAITENVESLQRKGY